MKKFLGATFVATAVFQLLVPGISQAITQTPVKAINVAATTTTAVTPTTATDGDVNVKNFLGENVTKKIASLTDIKSLNDILSPVKAAKTSFKTSSCPKPSKKIVDEESISLKNINKESGFDASYVPTDLVDISTYFTTLNNQPMCVRAEAATQLIMMNSALQQEGMQLSISSAYRSYNDQKKLYAAYAPTAAKVQYPRVAPAGHSEHQSGLAIDVASELAPGNFASSPESAWINQHAYMYGFLVSYEDGQEDKTGYMYEPWHLRYVGVENAKLLKEADYTLAYKPDYYKKATLVSLLKNLKQKITTSSTGPEIGG